MKLTSRHLLRVQVDEPGRGDVGGVRVAACVRRVHARHHAVSLAAVVRVLVLVGITSWCSHELPRLNGGRLRTISDWQLS